MHKSYSSKYILNYNNFILKIMIENYDKLFYIKFYIKNLA